MVLKLLLGVNCTALLLIGTVLAYQVTYPENPGDDLILSDSEYTETVITKKVRGTCKHQSPDTLECTTVWRIDGN
jgi:hypothetical protein